MVVDYDPAWTQRFAEVGSALRSQLGPKALRIDHIGSTSVPGLAAKDVIDVQVTVLRLSDADDWPDALVSGLMRRPAITRDHVPASVPSARADWEKRYWSAPGAVHAHVREDGRLNQRYALLFRDYLRSDAAAAGAYETLKRALTEVAAGDGEAYYAVKDPACDLIVTGAEHWARQSNWAPAASDT